MAVDALDITAADCKACNVICRFESISKYTCRVILAFLEGVREKLFMFLTKANIEKGSFDISSLMLLLKAPLQI